MFHYRRHSIWFSAAGSIVIFYCLLPILSHAQAGNTKQLFDSRCSMCHTVGGGRSVGPDLLAVRNWPQAQIRANVVRMQMRSGALKPVEIDQLVRFLSGAGGSTGGTTAPPSVAPAINSGRQKQGQRGRGMPSQALPPGGPGDWQSYGAQLYSGRVPFAKNGMACMGCHAINGASSGPGLAEIAHEKGGGKLLGFLQNPENRQMRQAYAGHPITVREAEALSAYFATVGGGGEQEREDQGFGRMLSRRFRGGEGREDEGDDDD